MALLAPKLDSRSWAELVAEARELAIRSAPGWTDHNLHDPGITLVELFAWLTEHLLFRLDRVTPAMERAFLRLVGVRPRPVTVASTAVALRLPPGAPAPVAVPGGTHVADATGRVVFETTRRLVAVPVWLALDADEPRAGSVVSAIGDRHVDRTAANGRVPFEPLGPTPEVGDALLLGFDRPPVPAGGLLSLHVWTPVFAADAATRQAIVDERNAAVADCHTPFGGPWPENADCERAAQPPVAAPARRPLAHYSAATVWEHWTGAGGWQRLGTVVDDTRALTLTGSVRLGGAAHHVAGPDDGRFWLRCRLEAGGYDCPPSLLAVAVNAVTAVHAARTGGPEELGITRGAAGEQYELARRPVVPGSVRLRLQAADGTIDDSWTEVGEWDESGPSANCFRTDPIRGAVTFADGHLAAVPRAGAKVIALGYRVGGGATGNAPRGTLSSVRAAVPAGSELRQAFAAIGGAPAEPLIRAHGRALDLLADPTRAVTVTDLESLAVRTPGVPIARAAAIAGLHPSFPCLPAPGVVTVVVVPPCGSPPVPSPALLRQVQRYLDRRRPLATEVHVVGPEYIAVEVSAALHVPAGSRVGVVEAANAALNHFLSPLEGGPRGDGWPFGRDVIEGELLAVLQGVPGVSFVDGVSIRIATGSPRCGHAMLCGTQLVDAARHDLVVKEDGQ